MKKLILYIFTILLAVPAFSQDHKMGMGNTASSKHLPFFTKIGHREIYHLYINDTTVNYTGKKRPAMAINGTIPAPQLTFTEGDTAEIYVHNEMIRVFEQFILTMRGTVNSRRGWISLIFINLRLVRSSTNNS